MLKKLTEQDLERITNNILLDISIDSDSLTKDKLLAIATRTISEFFTLWWTLGELWEYIQARRQMVNGRTSTSNEVFFNG